MSANRPSWSESARRISPRGLIWQPEHNLIAAMLEYAIADGFQLKRGSYPHRRCLIQWFHAEARQPFSFLWCCEQIGQRPEAVAGAIMAQWDGNLALS